MPSARTWVSHVAHLPAVDGLTEPYTPEYEERAWQSFLELPGPVLVHCSAGMERTFRVVNHILARLEPGGGNAYPVTALHARRTNDGRGR